MVLFLLGIVALASLLGISFAHLPQTCYSATGDAITRGVLDARHITDVVTAVNFDYRGFDTLGEEFILFVSVMGSVVLLRKVAPHGRRERRDADSPERDIPPSAAMRVWTLGMAAPKVLFGIYVVTHGQLTPGGGFQGGVILATAPLLVYLALGYSSFARIAPHELLEPAEAAGAGGYAIFGLLGLLLGKQFLSNVLPLGHSGDLFSGGTIALISLAVGLEVAAGFLLLLYGFLSETVTEPKPGEEHEGGKE
jgi:multicomponent Na+:H+ antiporter subunit B